MGAIPLVEYQGDWHYIQEEIIPTDPFGSGGSASTANIGTTLSTSTSGGGGSFVRIRSISGGASATSTTNIDYNRRWYWDEAKSLGRRAAIPLVDIRLDQFMEFLREVDYPASGDFCITIRSSYEYEGMTGRVLVIGGAIFPEGTIQGQPSAFDLELIQRFCTLRTRDPEPEEEALARAWREIRANEEHFEKEHQLREDAIARSLRLLRDQLTEEQIAELEEHNHFTMVARDGRPYRISTRSHGNVWLLNPDGQEMMNFCIVTQDSTIPIYDQMLSQKLMLEYHPEGFFRLANARVIFPNESLRQDPVSRFRDRVRGVLDQRRTRTADHIHDTG